MAVRIAIRKNDKKSGASNTSSIPSVRFSDGCGNYIDILRAKFIKCAELFHKIVIKSHASAFQHMKDEGGATESISLSDMT